MQRDRILSGRNDDNVTGACRVTIVEWTEWLVRVTAPTSKEIPIPNLTLLNPAVYCELALELLMINLVITLQRTGWLIFSKYKISRYCNTR